MAKKQLSRRWKIVICAVPVLVVLAWAGLFVWGGDPVEMRIGYDTTRIDGPLNSDGTVNYVAWLDARCAEGVTSENNAAPIFLKVFGIDNIRGVQRAGVLRRLGMTQDELDAGPRFIPWDEFHKDQDVGVEKASSDFYGQMLSWDEPVPKQAEAWLAANDAALDLLVSAVGRPRLYIPLVSTDEPPTVLSMSSPPDVRGSFGAAKALLIRAMMRARAGDAEAAWRDIMGVHHLGRTMAQYPSILALGLSRAIDTWASSAASQLVLGTKFTPGQLSAMQADVEHLPPAGDLHFVADTCERFFFLDAVTMLSRGGAADWTNPKRIIKGSAFDWNVMLQDGNAIYDAKAAALLVKGFAQRKAALPNAEKMLEDATGAGAAARMLVGRALGSAGRRWVSRQYAKILLMLVSCNYDRQVDAEFRAEARLRLERLSLALAAYRAAQGRWPERLEDLSPAHLAAIPVDPFTDGPFVYRTDGTDLLLYSIGPNLRDDQGWDNETAPPGEQRQRSQAGRDDIAIRTPGWDSSSEAE